MALLKKGHWKVSDTDLIYNSPWLKLYEDQVVDPAGVTGVFNYVELRDGVSVLPMINETDVCLIREFRYAIGRESIEVITGGLLNPSEDPLEAAKRELKEEVGGIAADWEYFGTFNPFPDKLKQTDRMYIAKNIQFTEQNLDPCERLTVMCVPLATAVGWVMDGTITHASSCCLILKADKLQKTG